MEYAHKDSNDVREVCPTQKTQVHLSKYLPRV